MDLKDFIEDALEEFNARLYQTLDGLSTEELSWRPDSQANSIAFIVWHVARVEDRWTQWFARDSVEVWIRDGWYRRVTLPEGDTGIGYSVAQISSFPALTAGVLRSYADGVRNETLDYLHGLAPGDFDLRPGRRPFPDVGDFGQDFTIGRMYRQLIGETNQHLGQVRYLRGLERGLDG